MWDQADISFEMVDDMTSDPVLTVFVCTPAGMMKIMAEPQKVGRR
jgi:hypothetical protein